MSYDDAGREDLRIDARGNRTTYTYDAAGRVNKRLYPDATRITWTYDANGNPTSVDQLDGNWTRSFDALNRVTAVTQPNAGTLNFNYDAAGRRTEMQDTEGGRTTYAYDDASRMAWLVNPDGEITSYSYDAAGRRTTKELANGTRASYTYDDANRVTFLGNLKSNNDVVSSFTYTYDAAGNRTNVVEADGDRVTWTYDATYQLLSETRDGLDAYSHTFTYDAVGNRLTKAEDGDVTTSTYDAANRLRFSESPVGDRTTYVYDADGNQRFIEEPSGDITTNTWSYENKLIQIEKSLDEVVTYTYSLVKRDNTEQRISKADDTTFIRFVWDEDRILAELDAVGSPEAEYTLEPATYGNLISQNRAAETSYYHYDALGSTRELTDTGEVQTDEYSFYAFGKEATSSGTTENSFGWVGQLGYYHDAESGNQTVRQNTYGSETGTWRSPDQIQHPGRSQYEYVGNNPTNVSDPSGLFNPVLMLEIVKTLRPDIYDWWKTENGVLTLRTAQGWILGWITNDVYATWRTDRSPIQPIIYLASEFNELDAAFAFMEVIDNGYFASQFRASQLLSGANDFSSVDNFRKWQDWFIKEAASTTATGARLILEWYAIHFKGTSLILTANDLLEGKATWWHALEVLPQGQRTLNTVISGTCGDVSICFHNTAYWNSNEN